MDIKRAIEIIRLLKNGIRLGNAQDGDEALDMAILALEKNEPEYPVCECCGKEIDHINTSHFNHDGTDSDVSYQIQYEPCSGCVSITTDRNWTDYELTDEERKEGIRCPYCGKYPFDKNCEIELYESVEVMMWKTNEHDEYKAGVEYLEHCAQWEPTYNPEDGSM